MESVDSRDEGERGYDDLVAKADRAGSNLEPKRCVADRDDVLHSDKFRNPALELLDVGSAVGQDAPVQHLVEPLEQPPAVADVRPAHMERFVEQRGSAEHREVAQAALCRHGTRHRHGAVSEALTDRPIGKARRPRRAWSPPCRRADRTSGRQVVQIDGVLDHWPPTGLLGARWRSTYACRKLTGTANRQTGHVLLGDLPEH